MKLLCNLNDIAKQNKPKPTKKKTLIKAEK